MAEYNSTLTCLRVGFSGHLGETPDEALSILLRRVEGNGYRVVSVSVLQPGSLPGERYEAYVVMRDTARLRGPDLSSGENVHRRTTMSPVAAGSKPLMRCFTDEELHRGLDAVIGGWNRCIVCGDENDDPHDAHPHPFATADPVNLFLEAARREETRADDTHAPGHAR